jgi:hypothetical protein
VAFHPASSIAGGGAGGNVFVTNFPPVQPVSVAALPLPDGAATEATLETAADALNDVALTAILERERIEP